MGQSPGRLPPRPPLPDRPLAPESFAVPFGATTAELRRPERGRDAWTPRRVAFLALLVAGYCLAAMGGLAISRQTGRIATLWPPNGIAVAVLLLLPRVRWAEAIAAGAAGSVLANLLGGAPLAAAASITVANVVECTLAATLVARWGERRRLFQQAGDVLVLGAAATIAATAAGVVSASGAALVAGLPFGRTFARWVVGDLLGLLVVTPIVFLAIARTVHGPDALLRQRGVTERYTLLALVLAVALAVHAPGMPPIEFLVLPAVVLASFRLGPMGAALATVLVAVVGSIGTVLDAQALGASADAVTFAVLLFQLHLAALFVSALPVGSAMARRAQLEADLVAAKERADRVAGEMTQLARVDALTGTLVRREFLAQLEAHGARAREAGEPLVLAMLDVDHFKPINDRFGHVVGDALLAAIGAACRSAMRTGDVIGRVGGEEFAMLLPVTDRETACRIAERLRDAVERLQVPTPEGPRVGATISIGLAVFAGQQLDRLLDDADRALYRAKALGRNRVAVA